MKVAAVVERGGLAVDLGIYACEECRRFRSPQRTSRGASGVK